LLQPVVSGKEIGNFKKDRTAKYANAWDSIKSPSTPNVSINLILDEIFF